MHSPSHAVLAHVLKINLQKPNQCSVALLYLPSKQYMKGNQSPSSSCLQWEDKLRHVPMKAETYLASAHRRECKELKPWAAELTVFQALFPYTAFNPFNLQN